jgi:hypothetical protein
MTFCEICGDHTIKKKYCEKHLKEITYLRLRGMSKEKAHKGVELVHQANLSGMGVFSIYAFNKFMRE